MVAELVRRNVESVSAITDDYEIILVNDASTDGTTEILKDYDKSKNIEDIYNKYSYLNKDSLKLLCCDDDYKITRDSLKNGPRYYE